MSWTLGATSTPTSRREPGPATSCANSSARTPTGPQAVIQILPRHQRLEPWPAPAGWWPLRPPAWA
ncbi:hypothetical protein [Ornithinimicrobium kibberense]|uniref:hypothetical protein n=1 Tax=Ornithinimicrobium kibberense TaxID=282060 RepID=UPI00360E23B1